MENNKKMRIISGSLKGKSINFVKNFNTRPLKDIVKENIFNILKHSNFINVKIENSKVLDLYSGIGSFGIECISRGASKVMFIEKDKSAVKILSENLVRLSIEKKTHIINDDIEKVLKEKLDNKFNIFFFDPPFADLNFINNLKLIRKKKLFHQNNIVIIHREKNAEDNLNKSLDIVAIKNYGRSKIIFGNIN